MPGPPMPERYRLQNCSAFPTKRGSADPLSSAAAFPLAGTTTEEKPKWPPVPTAPRRLAGRQPASSSSAAFAGSCPADKVVADGKGQKPGATVPKDVTDIVLGSIDLATQPVGDPGPPVPHAPARDQARRRGALAQPRRPPGADLRRGRRGDRICQQLRGADRAQCRRSRREIKGTSHWWQNTGKTRRC